MALSRTACTGSPLRLSEASIPPIASHATAAHVEPEIDLYAHLLARQKQLHRLVTQKPQNDLTLAATVHRSAKSQRAGRQSLAFDGENVDEVQARPHLPRPISNNLDLKIIGHVPVLLGHFD